jgi:DNA-binding CsgD family transcriptional regulator
MKSGRSLAFTYQGHLQNVYYASESIDEQNIFSLLSQFERLSAVMLHTPPLFFVIDYTRAGYLVMTDASRLITSHDPRDFLEGGIPRLIDVFQKEDFKVYNENVFPANIRFLQSQPFEMHHRFIFSYNFRVRHRDGGFVSILQRGSYITSPETGLPLYSLGMVTDITPFKRDTLIYHTIETMENMQGTHTKRTVESNCFFPNEEDKLLSKQERCVLGYMAEGWSSKQIAWKLKISENTIANHRKNILRKTNTKNVAELIAFACRSGLV